MTISIAEITPQRWDEVRRFCGEHAPNDWPVLTLVAEKDDVIIGVLMCRRGIIGGYRNQVIIDPEYRDQGVAATLLDKATGKLQMRGIRRCRINVDGVGAVVEDGQSHDIQSLEEETFWQALAWPAPPVLDDAPHVMRVHSAG